MIGETNLAVLLKNMQPVLNDGEYVFCTVPQDTTIDFSKIQLFFKEKEGITLIVEKAYADAQGFQYPSVPPFAASPIYAWISLLIHSSLDAVGLTAAFSKALAKENIPCNVVAGFYHDHVFVPYLMAEKAMKILKKLSKI